MTAERWDAAGRPVELYRLLRAAVRNVALTKAGRRKLRLAGVGGCRALWPAFTKERNREAVEAAERYADGLLPRAEAVALIRRVWWSSWIWVRSDRRVALASRALLGSTIWVAARAGEYLLDASLDGRRGCTAAEAQRRLCGVIRDVFGNPYRAAELDPRWATTTALGLARAIYEERAFDRLPILADALEDAGCDDAELLAHCRGGGEHVRGCWAVDWLLAVKPRGSAAARRRPAP